MSAKSTENACALIDRRTFLKLAGMGSVAFAAGCSPGEDKHLYSLVQAPEGVVTGQPTFFASVCRECPAGCGLLASNREGRAIKLEGNPLHPINQGRLCMRGQAALQALYHPDRLKTPLLRQGDTWKSLDFQQATALFAEKARAVAARGSSRVALLSECIGEPLLALCRQTLETWRSPAPLIFEPLAYESLKSAHALVNGIDGLPAYRLEQADLLLSFGADFLETWLSPVEYARRFTQMHALEDGRKGRFIHIAPWRTLTGANADRWLACLPGGQAVVALGLIRACLAAGRGQELPADVREVLRSASEPFTLEVVARDTGLTPAEFSRLGELLLAAQRPLVLGAAATGGGDAAGLATEVAAMALNRLLDPALTRIDLSSRHPVHRAARRDEVLGFVDKLAGGATDLLLINGANPAFSLQPPGRFAEALKAGHPFTVCFSPFLDETAVLADLVFPLRMALESWDVYSGREGLLATLQPASGRLSEAPQLGDVLLAAAAEQAGAAPAYRDWLMQHLGATNQIASAATWVQALQRGGLFPTGGAESLRLPGTAQNAAIHEILASVPREAASGGEALTLQVVPSLRFFDGRGANRPWLCEAPDPLTQICWQTPLCAHPLTLARHGLRQADVARIAVAARSLEAPVYASEDVRPGVLLMALGQGRQEGGRWAAGVGLDPGQLLNGAIEPRSGAPLYGAVDVKLAATGRSQPLAHTDGSRVQHRRPIALAVTQAELQRPAHVHGHGLGMDEFPLTLPLPEGYDPKRDFYPPHDHATYRWAMAVDLDRCIGCGACAVACFAENNIGLVGVERILEGREMAWLRIERYLEGGRVAFLPMMCQHCDNAPCEAVCPVYAPHHSKQGLNNQIYNRCIGTRFCGQNCPYKVRRFNWFQYEWPEPLNLQLNPDVTVRAKGVMEKCSFCVQRIKAAHDVAKNEKRPIRDGEVLPACAQTCPTGALTFGSLMDQDSRVSTLVRDARAYQAMGYLNTKPAVIYLKKVLVEV